MLATENLRSRAQKKEEVMISLSLFARYKPVPFVLHMLSGVAWLRPIKSDVGELVWLKNAKLATLSPPLGVVVPHIAYFSWLRYTWTCNSWHPQEGWLEVGSEMKGTGFHLAKRGGDKITSFSITTRTNPFPSYCKTPAEDRMSPLDPSKFLSQDNYNETPTLRRERRPVHVWHHSRTIWLKAASHSHDFHRSSSAMAVFVRDPRGLFPISGPQWHVDRWSTALVRQQQLASVIIMTLLDHRTS